MRPPSISAAGVGIPALDEEATIEACLAAIAVAARQIPVPVLVAVVADGCSDDTTGLGHGHVHVHGANLGVRASWRQAVGGGGPGGCGEDRELWDRLAGSGTRTIGVEDLPVTTSVPLESRVAGGFATYLAALI